ncbi:MAG TPA: helix-turn-helix transcriptional regulator, partial [Caldimonas sp.]|nr:helix-turn-helix transcriptional regulator [Caldimonas sp.]
MANIVRQHVASARKARGIKQKELATRIAMSQERLACIEGGAIACPLLTALKIAEALDREVRLLFPAAIKLLGDRRHDDLSEAAQTEIYQAGIDADIREWRVSAVLSGGQVVMREIGSRDMRRLFSAMQR